MRQCKVWLCWIVLLGSLVASSGCGHPEVSPMAYDYAMALYTITNRKADGKLQEVRTQIELSVASGELTQVDARALNAIADKAGAGNWKSANQQCRALMEAQVR